MNQKVFKTIPSEFSFDGNNGIVEIVTYHQRCPKPTSHNKKQKLTKKILGKFYARGFLKMMSEIKHRRDDQIKSVPFGLFRLRRTWTKTPDASVGIPTLSISSVPKMSKKGDAYGANSTLNLTAKNKSNQGDGQRASLKQTAIQIQINDLCAATEKTPRTSFKPASNHRSKYPELRGLDSQGPEYRKRYSKMRRLKNARQKPPQRKLL